MASNSSDTAFFGHPRGLATLFGTEMWERFSFYGLRAVVILYMTAAIESGGLGWSVGKAGAIYGMYAALVYMLSLPGGWVADKLIGLRRAVLYGGILIMLGQLTLAIPGAAFLFPGLGLIILGTGLLKPNVSVIVGELYPEKDLRRDAGFSVFYMGINLGATIAPLIVGGLAQAPGFRSLLTSWGFNPVNAWHWGFGVGALGMLAGVVQFRMGWKHLGTAGAAPSVAPDSAEGRSAWRIARLSVIAAVAVVVGLIFLVRDGAWTAEGIAAKFPYLFGFLVVAFFVWLFGMGSWTREERKRLVVVLVLFVASAIFWAAFEQAPSTLNLFALQNTRNSIFGWTFPSTWLQSVNSLCIIALAPVFAWIWIKLGTRDPSSPTKFGFGLLFAGLGFLVMMFAARASAGGVLVSPMWLVLTYLLHTVGELCLSPVGLSSMTKLAPDRVKGMIMGVWFLGTSLGNLIAGNVTRLYGSLTVPQLFGAVAAFCIVPAIIMFLLVVPIRRMLARA
ncbi:MAG TPA: peptide MFS transporter [Gemmatimonadales bacterium]|nr:peptide MFS transporter [Gemmatimonadales bacterium]